MKLKMIPAAKRVKNPIHHLFSTIDFHKALEFEYFDMYPAGRLILQLGFLIIPRLNKGSSAGVLALKDIFIY